MLEDTLNGFLTIVFQVTSFVENPYSKFYNEGVDKGSGLVNMSSINKFYNTSEEKRSGGVNMPSI